MRQRTITVESYALHVTDSDPDRSGICFVLIHGIGVSSKYFEPLRDELSRQFRVVCIDLPGFGRSARASHTLSIVGLAKVANQVIAQLGIERPVLVGHSMGCQVVTEQYVQQPDGVSGMVLIGPTVDSNRRGAVRHFVRLLQNGTREPARLDLMMTADYLRSGPRHYLKTLRYMLNDHIEYRLASCTVPSLVIRGTRDPIVKHDWAAGVTAALPDATLFEVTGAAHVAQFTHPKQVAKACKKLLNR
jgi:pimeloyl-ACP methyl ester carboxylesterase